jgi:hypothetical protein
VVRQFWAEAFHGAVEGERPYAIRIGRGEQDAHRPALGNAEKRRGVDFCRIHDGLQVVHPFVERRYVIDWVGQAGAAFVLHHQPRAAGQRLNEDHEGHRGVGPQVDVAEPSGVPHKRGVALTEHAIGEPDGAVAGVVNVAVVHAHTFPGRTRVMHRNPIWLMPVSIICGLRAAGR